MEYSIFQALAAANPELQLTLTRTITYTGKAKDIVIGLDRRALKGSMTHGTVTYEEMFSNEIKIGE